MPADELTNGAAAAGFSAVRRGRRQVSAASDGRRVRPWRAGAGAAACRLQPGRDSLAEDPRAATRRRLPQNMRARSELHMANSPMHSCASIRPTDTRRASSRRRATRLYGWTAERLVRKPDRGRPAILSLPVRPWLSGSRRRRAARLPRERAALRLRHVRADAAAWPKIPDTPGERALSDAMIDYWASFARRAAAARKAHRPGRPMARRATYMHFGDDAARSRAA